MDINQMPNIYHVPEENSGPCLVVNVTVEHGIWQSENPLTVSLPLLVQQIATVILVSRPIFYLLSPFNVPRIVCEILGGILLGPSFLRSQSHFFANMFPLRSLDLVETVAHWGLTYHIFLIGLEMEVSSVLRTGKKALHLALAGFFLPFILGICLFFLLGGISSGTQPETKKEGLNIGSVFWGAMLSVTAFPVVSRILHGLRIHQTEIGRLAMSTSVLNDMASWLLLVAVYGIPYKNYDNEGTMSLWSVIVSVLLRIAIGLVFAVTSLFGTRRALAYLIRQTSRGGNDFSDNFIVYILIMVSGYATISDFFGLNPIVGAFVFGLIMPNKLLSTAAIEKFESFVSGCIFPLYFAVCGIRIDVTGFGSMGNGTLIKAFFAVILAPTLKLISSLVFSAYYDMTPKEGLTLGLLTNTKGILGLIILNVGSDKRHLTGPEYTVMVLALLLMTAVVTPLVGALYPHTKRLSEYKQRTIQTARKDSELRILACFQNFRNVTGLINLIDSSNATKESPISLFTLRLVELTGRGSSVLIYHSMGKHSSRRNPQLEQIMTAFNTYNNLNDLVNIQVITTMSPFSTMPQDICCLAEDKHTALLILPFHKLPTSDGKLDEEGCFAFRGVNNLVLANAPCSVGIFVDRGFGLSMYGESNLTMRQIAMFFIGGPDDREALTYASRMAGTHGINLTVVRFLPGDQVEDIEELADLPASGASRLLTSLSYVDRQWRLDNDCVEEFKQKTAENQSVTYHEKVVNNDEELISALKEMHHVFSLYVVGKGRGMLSPLTAGLMGWCEYPELGVMGDLLVTSSFAQGSVLVVQQYAGAKDAGIVDLLSSEDSEHGRDNCDNWNPRATDNDDGGFEMTEPFAKRKGKVDDDEGVHMDRDR